jgi:hypothetical protein
MEGKFREGGITGKSLKKYGEIFFKRVNRREWLGDY